METGYVLIQGVLRLTSKSKQSFIDSVNDIELFLKSEPIIENSQNVENFKLNIEKKHSTRPMQGK